MCNQRWPVGLRPDEMLRPIWVIGGPPVKVRVSERALRLFACACCRRVWHELGRDCRLAVKTAERFADGLASESKLGNARSAAFAREIFSVTLGGDSPSRDAVHAAAAACEEPTFTIRNAMSAADSASLYEARSAGRACTKPFHAARRAARAEQAELLRHFARNPFRMARINSAWLTPDVRELALSAFHESGPSCTSCGGEGRLVDERFAGGYRYCTDCHGLAAIAGRVLDPQRLAVLSDGIEEAGCDDDDILNHLRSQGPHFRGMWSLDAVLGLE